LGLQSYSFDFSVTQLEEPQVSVDDAYTNKVALEKLLGNQTEFDNFVAVEPASYRQVVDQDKLGRLHDADVMDAAIYLCFGLTLFIFVLFQVAGALYGF
jgi:hypothetical protein